ncbi:hypothetical protein [Paraburkholderia sp.]|uniref:hypothetical protein n=1 Tax=Paraburkholderia sp. TaxID=1926495 RepID=UPI002396DB69|nr:hypothetical protein [Paraburkholderia sp.]MDE1180740.1 hypothetical protein [Paraburkholderia sp.]
MASASHIRSATQARSTSLKSRVIALLRDFRASFERHAELEMMLAAGFGNTLNKSAQLVPVRVRVHGDR